MAALLIVDGDITLNTQLGLYFEEMGHSYECVETLSKARAQSESMPFDIIFLNGNMPDSAAIAELKNTASHPEIILITDHDDQHGAEIALTSGAWHYIEKPPVFSIIKLLIDRVMEYRVGKLNHSIRTNNSTEQPVDFSNLLLQSELLPYKVFQNKMEHYYIRKLVSAAKGEILKACKISGISRARIYQLLKKHGLKGFRERTTLQNQGAVFYYNQFL